MALDDFHKIHDKLETGEIILDVRRPDEFASGHIPQAKNVPLDTLVQAADDLKKFKKIYIHCKRGGRAKTAFDLLSSLGLQNIVCIHDAGMDAWIEKGYPVKN